MKKRQKKKKHGWGLNLTTMLYLDSRLRKPETTLPFLHTL
jgi:hypothetical protein